MATADLVVHDHGSILILTPRSGAGRAWIEEHILVDGNEVLTWDDGIVVEPRYLDHIVQSAMFDGLNVQ